MKGGSTMDTIASCQSAIGFLYPRERTGCQSCQHATYINEGTKGPYQRGRWECGRYGFYTAPLSICESYEDDAQQGGAA